MRIVSASGVAACTVDGTTIHTDLHMVPCSRTVCSEQEGDRLEKEMHGVQLYIIDEYSFVSHRLFMSIASRLSCAFPSPDGDIFGKANVLLIGDVLQIPPVLNLGLWEQPKLSSDDHTAYSRYRQLFRTAYHLHGSFRQGGDQEWSDCLQRLRLATCTSADVALLNSRYDIDCPPGPDILRIFGTKRLVRNYNQTRLDTLPLKFQWICRHTISGSKNIGPLALNRVRHRTHGRIIGNPKSVELPDSSQQIAIDSRVMLVRNSPSCLKFGLCNGATGTVVGVWLHPKHSQQISNPNTPTVLVQFDEHCWRSTHSFDPKCPIVVPIPPMSVTFEHDGTNATRYWCPLKLAWAITSHKSQSMTLPAVAVDFKSMFFEMGLQYVAASRVRRSVDFNLLQPIMDWELKPRKRQRHMKTVE